MKNAEFLPPKFAAMLERIALKYGRPPMGCRHPTMEEEMIRDLERGAQRETRLWMREMEAQNWEIDGEPIVFGSSTENRHQPADIDSRQLGD